MWKYWFILSISIVILHTVALSQNIQKCSQLQRNPCTSDTDCSCRPIPLLCKANKCEKMNFMEFMKWLKYMQPCPSIHKQFCKSDLDCPCNKTSYECEDSECVIKKDKPRLIKSD